ncbi:hypothetical protein MMC25_003345 [Agyrium rufum]|nr:hypothetical protein [Agyrium rufum]
MAAHNPAQALNKDVQEASYEASSQALQTLTSAAENKNHGSHSVIHRAASHEESHSWIAKHFPTSEVLDKLEHRFKMGNYVIDRRTGEKTFEDMSIYVRIGMHLLYYGSAEEKALSWHKTQDLLKAQSEKMGKEYDAPESKEHIPGFIASFDLESSMQQMVQPDWKQYPTFNAFFAREIKESARPIDEPDNDLVTSSPADCRLTAFPTLDLATKYWIKGFGFTTARLLGSEELAQNFEGGSIVIARLAPQDYHRWHAPVSGTVESVTEIPGTYFTVNPQAINEPGTIDVFCENRRSVMMIRRSGTGARIAVIAVGAMLVGSIKYVDGVGQEGAEVRRGQCLGAFYYGGSTVIVLYPRGEVVMDEDLVKNSTEQECETYMQVGWRTGVKV